MPATVIPITQLTSPQLSSHLKAAVSNGPVANTSSQERLSLDPLGGLFSCALLLCTQRALLCATHAVPGATLLGKEGGGQAALAQRCVAP